MGTVYTYNGEQYYAKESGYRNIDVAEDVDYGKLASTYIPAKFSSGEKSWIRENADFFIEHIKTALLLDKIKAYRLREITPQEKKMPRWPEYITTKRHDRLVEKAMTHSWDSLTEEELVYVRNRPKHLEAYTKPQKKLLTKFLKYFDRMIFVTDFTTLTSMPYRVWAKRHKRK